MLTLEITLTLTRPHRAHLICTTERVKNLCLLILLMLICVNAHFFWTHGLVKPFPSLDHIYCSFTTLGGFTSKYFRDWVWPIMDNIFSAMLPNSLILSCLIYMVVKRCHKVEMVPGLYKNHFIIEPDSVKRFSNLAIILGTMSIIFTLPETCYNTFEYALERLSLRFVGNEFHFNAQRALAQQLCYIIRDLFLAWKFFLYFVGWGKFRTRAIAVMSFRSCRVYLRQRKNMRNAYIRAAYRKQNEAAALSQKHSDTSCVDQTEMVHPQTASDEPCGSLQRRYDSCQIHYDNAKCGLMNDHEESQIWSPNTGSIMTYV